jgi:hypothetical protein
VDRGVLGSWCPSLFTPAVDARSQPHASVGLPLGKNPVDYFGALGRSYYALGDSKRSQIATRAGKGRYRKTCSRGSGPEFCFAPLELQFLLWQQSVDVSIATVGVL